MKLSQMTTEQLQAKQVRITKILTERQNNFLKLFKANHEKLVEIHKAAGGETFEGTFAELINILFDRQCSGHRIWDTNFYIKCSDDQDDNESESIFGDRAWMDDSAERWNHSYPPNVGRREWILVGNADCPLTEAGACALLRVLGKE